MKKRLILCDFDETYFKHNTQPDDFSALREMETVLSDASLYQNAVVAILTGSTLESIMTKMQSIDMQFKPKHIFSDLSTKMYTWQNNGYIASDEYQQNVLSERFLLTDILTILHKVSTKYQVDFIPQKAFGENDTHYNFYFHSLKDVNKDRIILRDLVEYAQSKGYTVKYNRCNPLAGDPENAYDIDFIPKNSGKLYATQFLMDSYNISKKDVIGFGDSGNDEEFLSYLKHAFVMSNSSDTHMKQKFSKTKFPYYKGISTHVHEFLED